MALKPRPKVAILGCGQMSQKVAALLPHGDLCLWGRSRREDLPAGLLQLPWASTVAQACSAAAIVIFTVPIAAMRNVARDYGEVARGDQVVLFVARGVEADFVLPHTILRQETCVRKIGVLGGPLQAFDPQSGRPAVVVVGSRYSDPAYWVRHLAKNVAHVFATADIVGVQVAAAVGNITSIAVGMAQALRLGDTVRGLLLTRGLAEAARLGHALGAEPETFASLAGLGALIPHPALAQDKHILLGEALGSGAAPAALQKDAADGIFSVQQALALAQQQHFELPLIRAVQQVLSGALSGTTALSQVLGRGLDFGDDFAPQARLVNTWQDI